MWRLFRRGLLLDVHCVCALERAVNDLARLRAAACFRPIGVVGHRGLVLPSVYG